MSENGCGTDQFAVTSMCALFQRTCARDPNVVALRTFGGSVSYTWGEYAQHVRELAAGFAALGVDRGSAVAHMLSNRAEFHLCDTAAMHLGAVSFSIYNTLPPETIRHLLINAGARVLVCERQFLDTLRTALEGGDTLVEHLVCVDGPVQGAMSLETLAAGGDPTFDFEGRWRAVGRDDLLTLIYTSGTTGPPKGVQISHGNMLAQLRSTATLLPIGFGEPALSAFPMAHVAERWGTHYTGMAHGCQIISVPDVAVLTRALGEVHPPAWGSVPRVWEKLYDALHGVLASEPDPQKSAALAWAFDVGAARVRRQQEALAGRGAGPDADLEAEYVRADQLVLGGLRHRLGLDQLRWAVVGAAATPRPVMEFFAALGVPLCDIWGMSELSGLATLNPPGAVKIGTVGRALPGVELRLAEDGEVLVRGDIVMRGYHGEPTATAEAFDDEGWLRTGDIGSLDDAGYLSIIDRKKELIINASGKNMSPAMIESAIKGEDSVIGHVVAIGDGRPYNVALIVLDTDAINPGDAAADPRPAVREDLLQRVSAAVARANERLARVEQIKRFTVLDDVWEPGSNELTPTMKLKRKPIAVRYASEIDQLYRSGTSPASL